MQAAHICAYNECEDWLKELNEYLDENFKIVEQFFEEKFPDILVMKAQAGFLMWLNMKTRFKNEDEMKSFFENIKVKPVYGSYFQVQKKIVG